MKLHYFLPSSYSPCFPKSFTSLITCLYQWCFVIPLNPFLIQLSYFLLVSFIGSFVLIILKPKTNSFTPHYIDIFFMSVSSVTVSSMSTVEMEVFSNSQLVFMAILILVGGEVFTCILSLLFYKSQIKSSHNKVDPDSMEHQIEMFNNTEHKVTNPSEKTMFRERYWRYLSYVVLGYLLVILFGGYVMVMLYLSYVPSATHVLKMKGLNLHIFSVFTVISTFSNCGFIPTNENMIVFKNNPGLLLLLIPQVLLGNTLYPSCLRFVIWSLRRLTRKEEFQYMLNNTKEMGYTFLVPSMHAFLLVVTVFGLIIVQLVLFCCMEWSSEALFGMTSYQKVVGAMFQSVNARHAGESIVDLSIISPAVLVMFVFMMYLPPYTTFLPMDESEEYDSNCAKKRSIADNLIFSRLSYLVMFVILICISERKKMKDDPLNFSLLNVVIEVVSAYGNVGFSTGYSCKRQINPDDHCKDAWYGFSGRWSNSGKLILVVVMFLGRLKKFNMGGGKAWKLL